MEYLVEGQRALDLAEWPAARAAFASALEVEESAEALDGMGLARWFLGEVREGIAARERAVELYARQRRCNDAARVAVWVSHQHQIGGRTSAARGWLARAERAVADAGPCVGEGWVAMERARHAGSVGECARHAERALAIARGAGDGDLEVFALSVLGRATVAAGEVEPGMRQLEEAMALASAGRVRNVHTLGEAYCNLISACASAGDWERAREWCRVVDEFARDHGATPLFGACRTVHADVLLAAGRWADAEAALASALEAHERHTPQMGAPTVAAMAELRVRQGRLWEAERLLVGREEHPESLRALAHLRMAQQRQQIAAALLERGLEASGDDAVAATQLLAPLVDARLASGDHEAAAGAASALAALAQRTGIDGVRARAELALARVALAAGAPADARAAARRALAAFGRLAMPFEVAEARLELARALVHDSSDLARDEARTALAAFRALGALRAMDAAAGLLRDLDAATGARPRTYGELTAREREVLELLGLGMSNAQIAGTLVISEKTAGHHVSRILSKLGVRNRAEAAVRVASGQVPVGGRG